MGIFDEVVRLIRPRGVSVEDLISRDRHKNVSAARHEIMYWIRTKLKWSYPEIGRLFGRDHTTVLDACRKVQKENPTFGEIVADPYDSSSWIIR
jgi:chromosomal replication initiator protein